MEGVDYVATSANLMFSLGDSQQCHSVEIIDDLICEPTPENFFADMLLVSGFDVSVDPDLTTVLIDDSDEEECGKWDRTASKLLHRYIRDMFLGVNDPSVKMIQTNSFSPTSSWAVGNSQ